MYGKRLELRDLQFLDSLWISKITVCFSGTTFGIRSIREINSVTRHDLFGTPILAKVTYILHICYETETTFL